MYNKLMAKRKERKEKKENIIRYLFIVNPVAGKGEGKSYVNKIMEAVEKLGVEGEVYLTTGRGDGEKKVQEACMKNEEEKGKDILRVYACGGDGTLNEVVNGAYGFKKTQVGSIPIGSGNDFVRNFHEEKDFYSIEKQILGKEEKIDLMEYSGIFEGTFKKKVAINMFNIGFDANVANDTLFFRKLPMMHGKLPYRLAVGYNFIAKRGGNLTVVSENQEVHNGKLFFVNICNGCFLGGGMKGAPFARPNDGKMDVNIVKNVSRGAFLNLAPKYMAGTHMQVENIEKTITYMQSTFIVIKPYKHSEFRLGVDGEIIQASGELHFRILPKAIDFIVPE